MSQLTCPKCKGDMEQGYVVDYNLAAPMQSKWIPGEPDTSFWSANTIDKKKLVPVSTFRCINCGYLESYAKN